MPRMCFVPGCRTHKDFYERGVTMFSFPRDSSQLKLWNVACSRDVDFQPPRYACICDKHFDPGMLEKRTSGRRTLKMEAVPTRFLDGWKPDIDKNLEADSLNSNSSVVLDAMNPAEVGDAKEVLLNDPTVLDAKESEEAPNVEEVLLQECVDFASEVEPLITPDMFCRLCGIKQENGSEYYLSELRGYPHNDAIFNICLLEYEGLEPAQTICSDCHSELDSIGHFLQKCHEGQQRLLEQLSELKQMPIPKQTADDEFESTAPGHYSCDVDEADDRYDNTAKLSDEESNETEQMKVARLDRYIDRLMVQYKSARGRSRVLKSWECLDCRQVFQHRTHLAKHRRTCTLVGSADSRRRGPFRCELCDKVLSTLPGYRYHLMKMHDKKEADGKYPKELRMLKSNKVLTCPLCWDRFSTAAKLRYHLPSHKSTNQSRDSEGNILVKSGDPCMCSVCGKMERCHASLETHMKFHLKQKDWQCDQCDKQYYTKADLKQHVLAIHDKITYPCENCGLILKSKVTYARHKRVHDVSLQKRCSYCTKAFTTTNALNKHVRSRHHGMRRPRLHDIELPEELEVLKKMDDETRWEPGEDEDTFEEIIEEIVMDDATSDSDTKGEFKQETILIIEATRMEG